ncbi:MAG: hypothetical protein OXI87_00295 [Albidovulum sp.]|nr:hypothetical protein [Albidovulum sp.]
MQSRITGFEAKTLFGCRFTRRVADRRASGGYGNSDRSRAAFLRDTS